MKRLGYVFVHLPPLIFGSVAGYLVLAMTSLIVYDVAMRFLFRQPTYFADEFSGYMLVAITFLGAAITLRNNRHVSVEIVVQRLSLRRRRQLEIVTLFVSLVLSGILLWQTAEATISSYVRNETAASVMGTSLFIPRLVIPIGILALCIELAARIVNTARYLTRRR